SAPPPSSEDGGRPDGIQVDPDVPPIPAPGASHHLPHERSAVPPPGPPRRRGPRRARSDPSPDRGPDRLVPDAGSAAGASRAGARRSSADRPGDARDRRRRQSAAPAGRLRRGLRGAAPRLQIAAPAGALPLLWESPHLRPPLRSGSGGLGDDFGGEVDRDLRGPAPTVAVGTSRGRVG